MIQAARGFAWLSQSAPAPSRYNTPMFHLLWILQLILPALPPLSPSQQARLDASPALTTNLDEAGFYALLENARDWSDEAGAMIPDYPAIAAAPDEWRGKSVLIEGSLEMVMDPPPLSREGFSSTRAIVLRATGGTILYLYLIEPPTLTPGWNNKVRPWEAGSAVRVVGRFYSMLAEKNRMGEDKLFPVFVGRKVSTLTPAVRGPTGSSRLGFPAAAIAVMGFIFLYTMLKRKKSGGRLQDYLSRKKMERRITQAGQSAVAQESAPALELPADPASALDSLAKSDQNGHDG